MFWAERTPVCRRANRHSTYKERTDYVCYCLVHDGVKLLVKWRRAIFKLLFKFNDNKPPRR